ncbi:MAG: heme-binding protein [Gemmatimonadota bacterium]|nr:heme-binding protein [Gemmatimonadota bacterium]
MKGWVWVAAAAAGTMAFVAYKSSRGAYETAEYELLEAEGDFEIRAYPDLVLVSAPRTSSSLRDGSSFTKLFRYISGDNAAGEKIAMTTPVFMSEESGGGKMSFVVPKQVALTGAPRSLEPEVELETMQRGSYAAVRFSGDLGPQAVERQTARLRSWIQGRGLSVDGPRLVAGYDPPFTPPFLRRNEVLLPVRRAEAPAATTQS